MGFGHEHGRRPGFQGPGEPSPTGLFQDPVLPVFTGIFSHKSEQQRPQRAHHRQDDIQRKAAEVQHCKQQQQEHEPEYEVNNVLCADTVELHGAVDALVDRVIHHLKLLGVMRNLYAEPVSV